MGAKSSNLNKGQNNRSDGHTLEYYRSTFIRGGGGTNTTLLGSSYQGGTLICFGTTVRWVVAPGAAEVSRNWPSRSDANTRAQQVSGCTGWFVPNTSQLQNPGYSCRIYWDYSAARYWSDTQANSVPPNGGYVNFSNGVTGGTFHYNTLCVRSLRCVAY